MSQLLLLMFLTGQMWFASELFVFDALTSPNRFEALQEFELLASKLLLAVNRFMIRPPFPSLVASVSVKPLSSRLRPAKTPQSFSVGTREFTKSDRLRSDLAS